MKINTEPKLIQATEQEVFNFLFDLNNYEELFPSDKIKNWTSTDENCLCEVKGMGKIGLKRVAATPNTLIYLDSEKAPLKFTLNLFINNIDEKTCNAHLEFDGEINPFMKMMIEKPLTDFLNSLVFKLAKRYNS